MEMAKYILSILRTNPIVVLSWGFCFPVAITNGLRFIVNGFLHQGIVEVIYEEGTDLFTVRTLTDDGSIVKSEDGIALDELVNVIDSLVECDTTKNEYKEKVENHYRLA